MRREKNRTGGMGEGRKNRCKEKSPIVDSRRQCRALIDLYKFEH